MGNCQKLGSGTWLLSVHQLLIYSLNLEQFTDMEPVPVILFCKLPFFKGKGEGCSLLRNTFYINFLFVRLYDVLDDR